MAGTHEDEKEKMEEMHQRKVEKKESAEGSAGLLHQITKPTMWRGGVQILKKEEEDARLLDRCKAKRKEWANHWQCDESVQNVENKPWKNEELKKIEEASPRLKECDLEKASGLYKAKTGVGCDLDFTKEPRKEVVEFVEKVEQSGKWPQQACTTMFFLISKKVTSERPIALMPPLTAPEVAAEVSRRVRRHRRATWRSSAYSVGSIDGNGEIYWKSKSRGSRGCGLGYGPGEGQPSCGLGLGDVPQLPKDDLASAVRLL